MKLFGIILLVLLSLLLGCAQRDLYMPEILTTIYPLEIIAREIAGEKFTVGSFIPENASPHTYSPVPSDMIKLENALLVFSNGFDLEVNLRDALDSLGDKHVQISNHIPYNLLDDKKYDSEPEKETHIHSHDHHDCGEKGHCGECGHEDHHEHADKTGHNHGHQNSAVEHLDEEHCGVCHHLSLNPHIWTDVDIIRFIAMTILQEITKLAPEDSEYFTANFDSLLDRLEKTDELIKTERENFDRINIITQHDAFYYFNRRYNINQPAVIMHSPGKEPSPRYLAGLGEIVEKYGIKSILTEPQLDPKSAEVIAAEFGLELLLVDPLGNYWEVETIDEYLIKVWEVIKKSSE